MGRLSLSINAGSSSVKVTVFKGSPGDTEPSDLAVVQIAGLTAPPATLSYERGDVKINNQEIEGVETQADAFKKILDHLIEDEGSGELKGKGDVEFACHRVVHGGDYDKPVRIDRDTYHHLEESSDSAPLHNAGALAIVKAVHDVSPSVTNIAFFDSTFHSTIPLATRTYMIDPDRATHNKSRKYGFHGLSYAYITRTISSYLSIPRDQTNIIASHLGSGASACCIKGGKSIDTTMGLTPSSGLPGATRSGDVDPSLIFHFTHDAGKPSRQSSKDSHITEAEQISNKESGWKAITGTTDFGKISQGWEDGDEKAKSAFEIFADRIVAYVGSYYVRLGGEVDASVFAGGIGEKGAVSRKYVVEKSYCSGFELDEGRNASPGKDRVVSIGKEGARHKVSVCQTDEQTEMARQCVQSAADFKDKAS